MSFPASLFFSSVNPNSKEGTPTIPTSSGEAAGDGARFDEPRVSPTGSPPMVKSSCAAGAGAGEADLFSSVRPNSKSGAPTMPMLFGAGAGEADRFSSVRPNSKSGTPTMPMLFGAGAGAGEADRFSSVRPNLKSGAPTMPMSFGVGSAERLSSFRPSQLNPKHGAPAIPWSVVGTAALLSSSVRLPKLPEMLRPLVGRGAQRMDGRRIVRRKMLEGREMGDIVAGWRGWFVIWRGLRKKK